MPLDWEHRVITKYPGAKTRFTSVEIQDPSTCHKFFGKYAENGETILVCEPERSACKPYIVIPDGVTAVIQRSGAFEGYWEAGFYPCLPWTNCKYLVSQQDFVYESPGNRVITRDNVQVDISLSILLKIKADESDTVQQLVTNVQQINEVIDANIIERVRLMGRSVRATEAYSLRGGEHAKGMLDHLNLNLGNKGILVKRCIITSVVLLKSVADSMQEKTIYQFKNTLERKKFAYDQRILNDQEEEVKTKQAKEEEGKDENEKSQLIQLEKKKEIEAIKAQNRRIKSEWEARTDALINQINADTELKYNEIVAEAKLEEVQIVQKSEADAAELIAKGDAYRATTVANAHKQAGPLIAEAVKLEGEAEAKLQKAFAQKRTHEQMLAKIDAIGTLGTNKNSVIFGDQGGNLLAQIESFKMASKNDAAQSRRSLI